MECLLYEYVKQGHSPSNQQFPHKLQKERISPINLLRFITFNTHTHTITMEQEN